MGAPAPLSADDLAAMHAAGEWEAGRDAVAALPPDTLALTVLGRRLIARGVFELAGEALTRAVAAASTEADAYDALLGLSALLNRWGDRKGAKALLARAAAAMPFEPETRAKPGRPNVLRLRQLDNVRYVASHSKSRGEYKLLFKGGHFSIRDLIEKDRFNIAVANILGGRFELQAARPRPHLVLNTIGCADLGREALIAASEALAGHPDLPIVNHPARVLETTRDGNYERLSAIPGLIFPRTERILIDDAPRRLVKRLEGGGWAFPMILRRAGTQTGESVARVVDPRQARKVLDKARTGEHWYAIALHDARDPRGRHRKIRCFFIDGRFFPVACLGSDDWQIHSDDRYRIMSGDEDLQREEQTYLSDPEAFLGEANFRALHAVADIVKLDFFGIDFAVDPQGRILVFEANPAMRHNFNHAVAFPYTRPHLEAIGRAFTAMILKRTRAVRGR